MFCPKCGAKNEEGSMYCGTCGALLKEQQRILNGKNGPYENPGYDPSPNTVPPAREMYPHPQRKSKAGQVFLTGLEVVAAIGLLAGTIKVLGDKYDPKTVALDYWKATAACEWSQAYEYCDFPESDLLSKQMYLNANAEKTIPITYKSVEITDSAEAVNRAFQSYEDQLSSMFGVDTDDIMEQAKQQMKSTDAKQFVVEYLEKGSAEKQYTYLSLTRTGRKRLLFWDEWKVSSTEDWCQNLTFEIPAGAAISLNGVAVPEDYRSETGDAGRKNVTIPYLFSGNYQMEVTEDGMEPYRKMIEVSSYGCDDTYVSLVPSGETFRKISEQAGKDLQSTLEAALSGADFQTIENLYSKEALEDGYVKENYQDLVERLRGDGSDSGVVTFELNQVTVTPTGSSGGEIDLEIQGEKRTTYRQWNGKGTDTDPLDLYVTYVPEGDGWKLTGLQLDSYDIY